MHDKIAYLVKHNRMIQMMYRLIIGAFIRLIGLFVSTKEKQVLFSSYGGKKFNDSPKTLFDAMRNDARFSDYRYVWAFEHPEDFDVSGMQKVKIDTLRYFIVALQSKIWITNVNIERGLRFKKKGTIYLNTWHGTGPKKSGNAIKTRNDYDFSNVDILCCDGEYYKEIYLKYYNASKSSFLMCGRPREDELFTFTEDDKAKFRKRLGIPNGKRIILLMPTWREYEYSFPDFLLWKRELGEKYVILFRAHHFEKATQSKNINRDFVINVTDYDNVNELYFVSDILISDYSSAFFDFGLLGKPMLCYANDYQRYCESTGLFMDLEKEFPNGVIKNEEILLSTIKSINDEEAGKDTVNFIKKYVSREGNATICCLDRLIELIHAADNG